MALTNESAQKIAEAVVTDVNANVAAEPAVRTRVLSPEAKILFDNSIVAKPLNAPEVCSLHVKNTGFYYRWVNAQALGGSIFMQRKAMGFQNATTDDVELLVGDITGNDKEIRAGDLILMKLPYDRWASHVKSNMVKARTLGNMRGVFMRSDKGDNAPSTDVYDDSKPVRASVAQEPFVRGKAEPFIPSNPDEIIDRSISSGNVHAARAVTDGIRENIAKEKRS